MTDVASHSPTIRMRAKKCKTRSARLDKDTFGSVLALLQPKISPEGQHTQPDRKNFKYIPIVLEHLIKTEGEIPLHNVCLNTQIYINFSQHTKKKEFLGDAEIIRKFTKRQLVFHPRMRMSKKFSKF